MSAIGGRTQVASRAASIARPRRLPVAEIVLPCICTGSPSDGDDHGSGWTNTGGGGVFDNTPVSPDDDLGLSGELCSSDMDVTVTLTALTAHSSAYPVNRVNLAARVAGPHRPFVAQGYVFSLVTFGGGPTNQYELWTDSGALSAAYTSAAPGVAANGDVLELQVHGSSIVAKYNGSTIFSVTDSNIGDFVDGQPTSYASYEVVAGGTSDIGATAFSATPDC